MTLAALAVSSNFPHLLASAPLLANYGHRIRHVWSCEASGYQFDLLVARVGGRILGKAKANGSKVILTSDLPEYPRAIRGARKP
jgi:hypothetical protein